MKAQHPVLVEEPCPCHDKTQPLSLKTSHIPFPSRLPGRLLFCKKTLVVGAVSACRILTDDVSIVNALLRVHRQCGVQ